VVEVGAGYWFACARTADGRVFCWGNNTEGQLGSLASANAGADGDPPDYRDSASRNTAYDDPCFLGGRCSPAASAVAPGRRWAALSVGVGHACALAADDGGVYCWGGTKAETLGPGARMVPCVNRSAAWEDTRCQPEPERVTGLPPLAPPRPPPAGARRDQDAASGLGANTRVVATREQVRVIFPADTMEGWGWPSGEEDGSSRGYLWSMSANGLEGGRNVTLGVSRRDTAAREFASLQALVAAGEPMVCPSGPFVSCARRGVRAEVQGRNVVLVIHDTALVRTLFAPRPRFVRVYRDSPDRLPAYEPDSARVEYADPQIPSPTPAVVAEAERARRRDQASINAITRRITGGQSEWGDLWMVVGDSVPLKIEEVHCRYDVCGSGHDAVAPDSAWSVGDRAVVRLRIHPPRTRSRWEPVGSLIALRPGRTTLRVTGIHGVSDTVPSSRPVPTELERTVVVTRPIAGVRITPMADSARVGETGRLDVRVLDVEGNEVEGAPVELRITGGRYPYVTSVGTASALRFDMPGTWTIVASFAGKADTARVMVRDTAGSGVRPSPAASVGPASPVASLAPEPGRERADVSFLPPPGQRPRAATDKRRSA
jgi:hypothetical protein